MSNFFPWEKWGRATVHAAALEGVGSLEDLDGSPDSQPSSAWNGIFKPFGLIN